MSAPVAVSVTTSATLLIAKNRSRTEITFQNLDAAVIYYGTTTGLTTSNGIELAAGATVTMTRTKDNEDWFYTGDIYAIDASGTSDVRVWEKERERQ